MLLPWTQKLGFSLVPVYYDQPVIDLEALRPGYWDEESDLVGIDLRLEAQVQWLESLPKALLDEVNALPKKAFGEPHEFFLENRGFESVDAEAYYCRIRQARPKKIVEIGCGYSTFLAATAVRKNLEEGHQTELWAIDPYLKYPLNQGFPGLTGVRAEKVEEIPVEELLDLAPGDIFFIDSSHILTLGSDVQYLFLEVLPRIPEGVLVHIHDIFLPGRYPKKWTDQMLRFYNEQELLQAFLAFNPHFEVIWAGQALHRRRPEDLERHFASYDPKRVSPGSFWIRRKLAGE